MNKVKRLSQRLLGAGVLFASVALIQAADQPVHQDLLKNYSPQQLTEHVWMIEGPRGFPSPQNGGFMNNPGYIVTADSVVVIDPGSSAAIGRAVVAHIKQQTDKPVTHVFTTHVHGDHWLANEAIRENWPDAVFYAHPNMITLAKASEAARWLSNMDTLTEGATAGTEALIPTEALSHEQVFEIGGVTLKAHLPQEKAHTTTDVMYEVVNDKLLFTGDNINHLRIVRMDDGSFVGNIAAADYALALDVETIVPGHGPRGNRKTLQLNRNYLATVYGTVKDLREDLEPYEIKPKVEEKLTDFRGWTGFEDELGKHISLSVLEAEMEDF
ncbi:MAG: MBL fold metallo-hydrolase [Thiolinea sp.]